MIIVQHFVFQVMKRITSLCPGHKIDFTISLKTPMTRERRDIQANLEMGLSQVLSGNSRKLEQVASDCLALHVISPKS